MVRIPGFRSRGEAPQPDTVKTFQHQTVISAPLDKLIDATLAQASQLEHHRGGISIEPSPHFQPKDTFTASLGGIGLTICQGIFGKDFTGSLAGEIIAASPIGVEARLLPDESKLPFMPESGYVKALSDPRQKGKTAVELSVTLDVAGACQEVVKRSPIPNGIGKFVISKTHGAMEAAINAGLALGLKEFKKGLEADQPSAKRPPASLPISA